MSNTFKPQVGMLVRFKCVPTITAPYHHAEAIIYHISSSRIHFFFPKRVSSFSYGHITHEEVKDTIEDLGTSPKHIWEAKYPELSRYWDHELP
jgi:hypothetical protein